MAPGSLLAAAQTSNRTTANFRRGSSDIAVFGGAAARWSQSGGGAEAAAEPKWQQFQS